MLRLGQGIDDGVGLAHGRQLGKVGPDDAAAAAHHVAGAAIALAPEHRLACRHIARRRRVDRGAAQAIHIGRDLPDLVVGQLAAHARASPCRECRS